PDPAAQLVQGELGDRHLGHHVRRDPQDRLAADLSLLVGTGASELRRAGGAAPTGSVHGYMLQTVGPLLGDRRSVSVPDNRPMVLKIGHGADHDAVPPPRRAPCTSYPTRPASLPSSPAPTAVPARRPPSGSPPP